MMNFYDILFIFINDATVVWAAITVAAFLFYRRRQARAERLMLVGAGLTLLSRLLNAPLVFTSVNYGFDLLMTISVIVGLMSAAGIACLIYAFWVKFKERNNGAAQPAPQMLERGSHDADPAH